MDSVVTALAPLPVCWQDGGFSVPPLDLIFLQHGRLRSRGMGEY